MPVVLLVCLWMPGHLTQALEAPPHTVAGIFGKDDRVAVDSAVWPWVAIGLLQRKVGGACTATLVSENAVLTAAHCLFDHRGGRQLAPSEVRFLAGYHDGKAIAESVGQGFILNSPHGQTAPTIKDMRTDWAIVVLRKTLPIRPLALRLLPSKNSRRDAKVGQAVARAGYSEDHLAGLSVDPACRILHRDPADLFLFTNCDTLKGDSGSPLLVQGPDDPAVVGVVSGLLEDDRGRPGAVVIHAGSILPALAKLKIPGVSLPGADGKR